jgi:hypothetical protein
VAPDLSRDLTINARAKSKYFVLFIIFELIEVPCKVPVWTVPMTHFPFIAEWFVFFISSGYRFFA